MSKTQGNLMVEWKDINWRKVEKMVFKLQKRIYRASERGDVVTVRKLQKTLMRSWYAKLLAVRKVTQDNKGKKTAGIDGKKSYTPVQRLRLVEELRLSSKARPTRRVWIPKPGKSEKRPLGIPTMYDRALQSLAKIILEPEWEARFEPDSYGFRVGRSCHDAIEAIFKAIRQKTKYVLDADIAGCFDNISHDALLKKVKTFPALRRQIKAWLKAGVIDWSEYAGRNKGYSPTNKGTPQGGTLSPLLANIALHGMENRVMQFIETLPNGLGKRDNKKSLTLVRYADDFVVIHEDLKVIQDCKTIIADWLKEMGLELKPSKTRISHTLNLYTGKSGFDFLGFNIRQYPVGKYKSPKRSNGKTLLGFKTIIKPSNKSIQNHYHDIASTIDKLAHSPQEILISRLKPIVKGWSKYFSTVCSKSIYSHMDSLIWNKLWAWAKYRCPKTGRKEIVDKYWSTIEGDNWVFSCKQDKYVLHLEKYSKTEIQRHTKVKGNSSPYNGELVYWSTRKGNNPEMPVRIARLLRVQKGKCKHCGLYFREEDEMEVDHIIPKKSGGSNKKDNLQLLHRHCHDNKTAKDNSLERKVPMTKG